MSVGVNVDPDQPSKLQGLLGPLLGIAGAIAAPFTGGASLPLMTALGTGAGLGSAAGNLVGGIADAANNAGKDNSNNPALQTGGSVAIQRRMQQQADNPLQHITNAISVVHAVDPAMREGILGNLADAHRKGMYQQNGWVSPQTTDYSQMDIA